MEEQRSEIREWGAESRKNPEMREEGVAGGRPGKER